VLAGEPVTWRNDDVIEHDVYAANAFHSGRLAGGSGAYTYAFPAPGEYAYRCTIHAFMSGSVSVAPVILEAPTGTVLAGQGVQLAGRAPAGTTSVTIERTLDGTTWADTGAKVAPDASGAFSAIVDAAEGAAYRATVAAGEPTGVERVGRVHVVLDHVVVAPGHGLAGEHGHARRREVLARHRDHLVRLRDGRGHDEERDGPDGRQERDEPAHQRRTR